MSSFLSVIPPSLFRSASAPCPKKHYSLSDFAHNYMWYHSRLNRWPNHFNLLFSRNVSTCFLPDVIVSDVVHLGIPSCLSQHRISAEFSFFLYFFFATQHTEPLVIACLIIVFRLCLSIPRASSYRTLLKGCHSRPLSIDNLCGGFCFV